jgi:hypothetical protein
MIGGLLKRKKLFEDALTHYYSAYETTVRMRSSMTTFTLLSTSAQSAQCCVVKPTQNATTPSWLNCVEPKWRMDLQITGTTYV